MYSIDITIDNNVALGMITTPINTKLLNDPGKLGARLKNMPLGRLGRPQNGASLVTSLVSSEADYITGGTFVVEDGLLWNYQEQ